MVSKLLHSAFSEFDFLTSLIEQFQDLDVLTLDEAITSQKIHEDKLKDRQSRRQEKALLAKALEKLKKSETTRERGRGCGQRKSKGKSTNHKNEDEEPSDKSKVLCFNCEKFSHYFNECRKDKKDKKLVTTQLAEEDDEGDSL